MKRTSFLLILTTCLCFLASSCRKASVTDSVFAEAEGLMYTHPDSAMKLMESIPNPDLLTGREQADYALLMTQAKSRNRIYATTDSLIRIAVDYYRNTDEAERKAKSLLYLGGVYLDMNQYSKAVLSLKEAELLLDGVEDPHTKSLIFYMTSYLNRKAGNHESALTYLKKALQLQLLYDNYSWYTGKLSDVRNLSYQEFTDSAQTHLEQLKKATVSDFFTHYDSKQIIEIQHKYDKEVILNEKKQVENWLLCVLGGCICLVVIILIIVWIQKRLGKERMQELQAQINKIMLSSEMDKDKISQLNAMLAQSKHIKQEYDQILQLATKKDIEALAVYLRLEQQPTAYSVSEDLYHLKHWLDRTSDNFASRLYNQYPHLSNSEINLCCLQRLGFSQEKMASIMQIKVTSVSQNIYRTCHKLGIKSDKHLFKNYICSF